MNTLDTLYFPGTVIFSGSQYPLFLLFSKVHVLQPVETAENDGATAGHPDIFIKNGFCQEHTPCPLGDDLKRFLRLIDDIKNRKDDYAAQLSSLTMAAMSVPRQQDDDTTGEIISSLLGTQGIKEKKEKEDAASHLLWQARLVLKIAEILDLEEEEIAEQISLLSDQEKSLFQQLHGDDLEDPEEEDNPLQEMLEISSSIRKPTATSIRNRCRAWQQLFIAGNLPDWPIWTTNMPEAADTILDRYENVQGKPAPIIGTFSLPASIGREQQEALEQIAAFRGQYADLLSRIAADLTAATRSAEDRDTEPHFPDAEAPLTGEWHNALASHFPEERFGRTTISIYSLPGQSCASLLGKTSDSAPAGQPLLLVSSS